MKVLIDLRMVLPQSSASLCKKTAKNKRNQNTEKMDVSLFSIG